MLNRVMLIGHLGRDPEVRRLESGQAVGKFSVATNPDFRGILKLNIISTDIQLLAITLLVILGVPAIKKGCFGYFLTTNCFFN